MPVPTHRDFQNEAIFILALANGKTAHIRGVGDRLGLFLQLAWPWPATDWTAMPLPPGSPAYAPKALPLT
jgi:hypothetical protein